MASKGALAVALAPLTIVSGLTVGILSKTEARNRLQRAAFEAAFSMDYVDFVNDTQDDDIVAASLESIDGSMQLDDMIIPARPHAHPNYDIRTKNSQDTISFTRDYSAHDDSGGDEAVSKSNVEDENWTPTQSRILCAQEMPKYKRALLMAISFPYHGSTALEGVLLSSKNLATLCSYNKWQCEGKNIMVDHGFSAESSEWDYDKMLELYSDYWNLSRPVLFEKSPLQMMRVQTVLNGLSKATLPPKMRTYGITTVSRGYLLMWRPVCLAHLSSHAREDMKLIGEETYAKRELSNLAYLVRNHWYVTKNTTEPILVVNVADMMWRPERNSHRLMRFAPCLAKIDPDYVPKMNIDIFPGNNWKADGSVRAFGQRTDPRSFYNVEEGTCNGEYDIFKTLSPELRERARALIDYLLAFS